MESTVDQCLSALTLKIDNLEQNVNQIKEQVQGLSQTQANHQQALDHTASVLQTLGQDLVNHQGNIQDIFGQVENLENQHR